MCFSENKCYAWFSIYTYAFYIPRCSTYQNCYIPRWLLRGPKKYPGYAPAAQFPLCEVTQHLYRVSNSNIVGYTYIMQYIHASLKALLRGCTDDDFSTNNSMNNHKYVT